MPNSAWAGADEHRGLLSRTGRQSARVHLLRLVERSTTTTSPALARAPTPAAGGVSAGERLPDASSRWRGLAVGRSARRRGWCQAATRMSQSRATGTAPPRLRQSSRHVRQAGPARPSRLDRLQHKNRDAPVRRAFLVLPKARIYTEPLLPDLHSALAIRLDGAHSPVDAVNHNVRVGMRT